MRVERRIREGAERNASTISPDIDRALDVVIRTHRKRRVVRRSVTLAVAVPVVALVLAAGPGVLDAVRGPAPAPATRPTPPPSTAPPPAPFGGGVFARTIDTGLAVVRANGLAGRWTIVTDAGGVVRLVAPDPFAGSHSWQLDLAGNKLRTDAFDGGLCDGVRPGTYGWARVGPFLVLSRIFDPCDARVWLLTSGPWRVRP